ncbi:hypothetical protein Lnau_2529 [Legionella nautarum]|uniref:Uncharacterized protein n=1 Tax=Legionella nautarum TaxID=45070 RepID=A0A0W0WKQ1_9GAMM|nr:hypothetical protein [Legionella nautarum]KTD32881.1 hypothetical protein Lnau_2529 [Legionella nautarum]
MYLSKLGFFREKTSIEQQQLIKYLNFFTNNLKNNSLKLQICYWQQELSLLNLLNISRQKAKRQQFSGKLKSIVRKRRAKKYFLLKKTRVQSLHLKQQKLKITPQFPAFPELMINKSPSNKLKGNASIKLH